VLAANYLFGNKPHQAYDLLQSELQPERAPVAHRRR
jgi:hypothetical protein